MSGNITKNNLSLNKPRPDLPAWSSEAVVRNLKLVSNPSNDDNSSHDASAEELHRYGVLLQLYENILKHIPAAVLTLSVPDYVVVQANDVYLSFLTEHWDDIVGLPLDEVLSKEGMAYLRPIYDKIAETGEGMSYNDVQFVGFGRDSYVTGTRVPILDENGKVKYILSMLIDTTERKRAEDDIKRRNEELEAINVVTTATTGPLDIQKIVSLALTKTMEVLGYEIGMVSIVDRETGELRQIEKQIMPVECVAGLEVPPLPEAIAEQALKSGEVVLLEKPELPAGVLKSGAIIPLKCKAGAVGVISLLGCGHRCYTSRDAELLASIGSTIGIAIENARLFADLDDKSKEARLKAVQLQSVLARNFDVQETERKRIARDMHDGVTQLVSGALLQVESAIKEIKQAGSKKQSLTRLEMAHRLLRESIDEVHSVIFDLSPPLVELGLIPALREYLALYQEGFDVSFSLEVTGEESAITPSLGTTIYRIIQEALQNVQKHSNATKVDICLDFRESGLVVTVQDNGVGFHRKAEGRDWHLGLMSMRERATSVGGTIEISSSKGQGTKVVIRVPKFGPEPADDLDCNNIPED